MISLTQASRYDTCSSTPLMIDPDRIEAIATAVVGERCEGAMLTMQSGEKFRVWQTVEVIRKAIANHRESRQPRCLCAKPSYETYPRCPVHNP